MTKTFRIEAPKSKDHLTGTMDVVRKNGEVYIRPKTETNRRKYRTCRPSDSFYRTPESTYQEDFQPFPRDDDYTRFHNTLGGTSTMRALEHTKRTIGKATTTYEDAFQPFYGETGALKLTRTKTGCNIGGLRSGTQTLSGTCTAKDRNASQIDLDRKCIADGTRKSALESTYTHDFSREITGYPVGFNHDGIRQHFSHYLKSHKWGDGKMDRAVATLK